MTQPTNTQLPLWDRLRPVTGPENDQLLRLALAAGMLVLDLAVGALGAAITATWLAAVGGLGVLAAGCYAFPVMVRQHVRETR